MMRLQYVFTLFTRHRAFLLQAVRKRENKLLISLVFIFAVYASKLSVYNFLRILQERQRDLDQWIEAFDPLLAGSILSRHGLQNRK